MSGGRVLYRYTTPTSTQLRLWENGVTTTVTTTQVVTAPLFMSLQLATPLDFSQWHVSKIATTCALNFFASGTALWM